MRLKEFFSSFDAEPISNNMMHGPITQEMIDYLQLTNEQKRKRSIDLLGSRWLLHPINQQQKEAR